MKRFVATAFYFGLLGIAAAARSDVLDSVTVSASALSEPALRGLAEMNGRPALALAIDWDVSPSWFLGAHGYITTSAPSPQRTQSYALFGGWRWEGDTGRSVDVALGHRAYPGTFVIDWDHTELRADAHLTRNIAVTVGAIDDYYGIGGTAFAAALNINRELTDNAYARLELGHVDIEKAVDSYSYLEVGGGYTLRRWNIELLLRTNDADPSRAFPDNQIDTRVTASVSYLIF